MSPEGLAATNAADFLRNLASGTNRTRSSKFVAIGALLAGALGADLDGESTVLLPILSFATLVCCGLAIRRRSIDAKAWLFVGLGVVMATAAYSLMSMGLELRHPAVLLLFLLTYPCTFASWILLVRIRTTASIKGLALDGFLIGGVCAVLLLAHNEAASRSLVVKSIPDFAVGVIFPFLSLATLSGTILIGSSLHWRFPRQLGLVVIAQIFVSTSDVFPTFFSAIPTTFGLSVRLAAAAYWMLIMATGSTDRWVIPGTDMRPPRGVLAVTWFAVLVAVALLLIHSEGYAFHYGSAVLFALAMVRMTVAYRSVTSAHELRLEARTDELTGLPNRRAFNEALAVAIRVDNRFSVMILDLDRFKEINDTMGHDVGDQVLCVVTARFTRVMKGEEADLRLFRLGGDEFACIVTPVQRAESIGEEMRRLVAVPIVVEGQRIDLDVSIGISSFPTDATEAGDLVRLSDTAMYRAKQGHSGIVRFVDDSPVSSPLKIQAALRNALENDSFELFYQPQILLGPTPKVQGVEALLRVFDGTNLLPTNLVIATAESTGMMPQVTRAVISRAIRDQARLAKRGYNIGMSFNISAADLSSDGIVSYILSMANRFGVSPSHITVEITEESLLHDAAKAAQTVDTLRAIGFSVSMDDFGVGFSSLTNLRMLAVSELKIDRSFVQGLTDDPRTEALVRSMVHLAGQLGAKVLIEGTETAIDARLAGEFGVDLAQGYLFSRPIPMPELIVWLELANPEYLRGVMGIVPSAVEHRM